MTSQWITITPKLQAGVSLINNLESPKFRLLLSRIASAMQVTQPNDSTALSAFTPEEEIKLEKSLGLQASDVRLVIETSTLILQQAAYHLMKPETLNHNLLEGLKMEAEKCSVISNAWTANARPIVEQLRHRSIFPHQLADINWMIDVETSSDCNLKNKEPVAVVEFLVQSDNNNKNERVQIEMRKPQLQKLYSQLEKMQTQLDALK